MPTSFMDADERQEQTNGLGKIAELAKFYYDTLIEQGFSVEMAEQPTVMWTRTCVGMPSPMPSLYGEMIELLREHLVRDES